MSRSYFLIEFAFSMLLHYFLIFVHIIVILQRDSTDAAMQHCDTRCTKPSPHVLKGKLKPDATVMLCTWDFKMNPATL